MVMKWSYLYKGDYYKAIALKEGIHRFIDHPIDTLLPGAIGPLMSAVIKGLGASRQ